MTLPDRIRAARAAAGLSQQELAVLLGTSIGAVCRWESGSREPTGLYRAAILDWLEDQAWIEEQEA